jgi:bifunctional non-homologous end joining protein LigD
VAGRADEVRDGVELKHLDVELFDGAGVTKRDLVDYLDAVADRILPELRDRPLTVLRVRPGQQPFMQKNLPAYAPEWIPTVTIWAQASHREVRYPLCHDRRTLLWFAGQRAVEFHPTVLSGEGRVTYLVLDLDPPEGAGFDHVVRAAHLVREALDESGVSGAPKTSGSKGIHVVVPIVSDTPVEDAMAATRALAARTERLDPAAVTTAFLKEERHGKVYVDPTRAGGASLACAYSPRARPGVPVSFPVAWSDLDRVTPADFTVRTAPGLLGDADPWRVSLPEPQALPQDLVAEGHAIPVPRVVAMHEGKRRARDRRQSAP